MDFQPGENSIENKWVLKIKCKADNSIEMYKSSSCGERPCPIRGCILGGNLVIGNRFSAILQILSIFANLDLKLN